MQSPVNISHCSHNLDPFQSGFGLGFNTESVLVEFVDDP